MNKYDWLKNLMAGDPVIVYCGPWSSRKYVRRTVEKITPKGYIRVNGLLYKPGNGCIRGDGWGCLENPNDPKIIELLVNDQKAHYIKNLEFKLARTQLTYEQAQGIADVMGWPDAYEEN